MELQDVLDELEKAAEHITRVSGEVAYNLSECKRLELVGRLQAAEHHLREVEEVLLFNLKTEPVHETNPDGVAENDVHAEEGSDPVGGQDSDPTAEKNYNAIQE